METRKDSAGTRSIVSTLDEYRAAVAALATRAQRSLSIYTPNLEPMLYDQDSFLEPVKRLVLARGHARLRVLISDPARVSREGNRFMQMGSYVDIGARDDYQCRRCWYEYRRYADAYADVDFGFCRYRGRGKDRKKNSGCESWQISFDLGALY